MGKKKYANTDEVADVLGVKPEAIELADMIGDDLPDGAYFGLVDELDDSF